MDLYWVAGLFAIMLLGGVSGVAWLIASVTRIRSRSRAGDPPPCPSCGSTDLRPSWPSGWIDRIYHACACEPIRCRACSFRFYRSVLERPSEESPGKGGD